MKNTKTPPSQGAYFELESFKGMSHFTQRDSKPKLIPAVLNVCQNLIEIPIFLTSWELRTVFSLIIRNYWLLTSFDSFEIYDCYNDKLSPRWRRWIKISREVWIAYSSTLRWGMHFHFLWVSLTVLKLPMRLTLWWYPLAVCHNANQPLNILS